LFSCLLQPLGKGAFADVYLGEHQLHPHIIRVFDFGLEAEVPFFVMDYAPNGNLRQLHPKGTVVSLSTVVSYVKALASALQYAHDQHLVHRDLKPENVLLGAKHEVLLTDFGLALLTSDMESLDIKERFGTLAYMAPEQILGQPCPASDQYALAVMIYELLCGQSPFQGSAALLSNQHLYAAPLLCLRGIPQSLPPWNRLSSKVYPRKRHSVTRTCWISPLHL
jgi:serine/threonine protein kinase